MASKKGYAPQINVTGGGENDDFDDPDQYMMLVRPFRNKKIPYLQMILPFIAVVLVIVGVSYDEVSDGDWKVDDSVVYWQSIDEIDYDCGWQNLRFTYYWSNGYEQSEKYAYSSLLCDEDNDVFNDEWCKSMKSLGKVWLGFNIVGILLSFASIFVVFKYGKASLAYFVLNFFCVTCYLISVSNWFENEKCSDIEYYSTNSAYTVTTNVGTSMILVICALGVLLLALLVSSVHLVQKRTQRVAAVAAASSPAIN